MHQHLNWTVPASARGLCALTLAVVTLAGQAQAARLAGAFRGAAGPVAAPAMARAGAMGGYSGVRATPHFNTNTAAGPFPSSVQGRFSTAAAMPGAAIRRPPNMGFAQGQGRMQTHAKGTTVLRYGGPRGRFVTPDLQARPRQLALPSAGAPPPRHYYRLTQDIMAPTGRIAKAHGQPGGATQIVLNRAVRDSPMVRTITPNFRSAAIGEMR